MKKRKDHIVALLIIFISIVLIFAFSCNSELEKIVLSGERIVNFQSGLTVIDDEVLTDTTKVYFSSEITKGYGNGDCILLENYDSEGNKIYGLIDTGRKIVKKDSDGNDSTVVKEFLKQHGVTKLEFLAITHTHLDHNGDALTVLDNFEVDTIYMKEFDEKFVTDGTSQSIYEDMLERAVEKDIKVIGVSYLSLKSSEISPSRSQDFINNTKNAKEELFESFNEENTTFKFGSSDIQIYNWEMFDGNGKQYITGVTTDTTREIVSNENNNSIAFLVTQGDKKAFFSGDMNNLDENEATGRIGDEDRLKDEIGKVDFLKIGHHGYKYSNTEDYINVLKPEYAVITNDIGEAYKDILNWLKENNVNYLYTTVDEYGVSLTMKNDDIFLGFETTGSFKNVNGDIYYVPEGNEYKNVDYNKDAYKIEYHEKNVEVSSWSELKEVIENNKNDFENMDNSKKICTLYNLIVDLKSGGDWNATDMITVEKQQNIVLTTSENITFLRGTGLKESSLFSVNGSLSIGTDSMVGNIIIDGNKDKVEASSVLISIVDGTLNLYNNVKLCNNINRTTAITRNTSTQYYYNSFGSAIYSKNSTINMYGSEITNNSQDVVYTLTLPTEMKNNYSCSTQGAGIYMINNSILNMYGGSINNNKATNHSIVNTNSNYTNSANTSGISQRCDGVGIYANDNAEVNLLGGEIIGNSAVNDSSTTLTTATNDSQKTNLQSLNSGIYGVGIYIVSSKLTISNDFVISNNVAELNTNIVLEENTSINSEANSGIRGLQGYINDSSINIDGATISNGSFVNNTRKVSNGAIGPSGNGPISTEDCGGGLYIYSSKGIISNSQIIDNKAKSGGGIYVADNSSNVELNDVKIERNAATLNSGGGVYAYGNLIISGDETSISNNTAKTYGGGLMLKTKAIINAGKISDNEALQSCGGGIRLDGELILNGGTITGNRAKKTGGGIDYLARKNDL